MTVTTRVMLKLQALPEDQLRQVLEFIEKLTPETPLARTSLYGMFEGFDTSEEEIAEARREMWGNFPREDF